MSTRAIVARPLPSGGWEGYQVLTSGMPTSLGRRLHQSFSHFGDVDVMREFFCERYRGLAQFADPADVRPETQPRPDYETEPDAYQAYTQSTIYLGTDQGPGTYEPYTDADVDDDDGPWDIEWLYMLGDDGLHVHMGHPTFQQLGVIPWDAEMTDTHWQVLECGEHFERCSHYAWVHFPDIPDEARNLGLGVYLGREPFRHTDAIAVLRDGQRLNLTGSAHREGYPEAARTRKYGDRMMVDAVAADGERVTLGGWYVDGPKKGQWCDGLLPVYPDTLNAVPAWWKPLDAGQLVG